MPAISTARLAGRLMRVIGCLCVLGLSACGGCEDDGGTIDPWRVGADMGEDMRPAPDMKAPARIVSQIELRPAELELEVDQTWQLEITLYDQDGEVIEEPRVLNWASDNASVARVDNAGQISAISPGQATLSAANGDARAEVEVTVTRKAIAAVEVDPADASVQIRRTLQLRAVLRARDSTPITGREVSWSSSDDEVATVNASGLVTGQGLGQATITATSEGVTGEATVTVEATDIDRVEVLSQSVDLVVGQSVTLEAVARDSRGIILPDRQPIWSVGDDQIAQIEPDGTLTGLAPGETTARVELEGVSDEIPVTVTAQPVDEILLSPDGTTLRVGQSEALMATLLGPRGEVLEDRDIDWDTSNPLVAEVDASGTVTGTGPGLARITATSEGVSAEATVEVVFAVDTVEITPQTSTVIVGEQLQLSAQVRADDGTTLFRPVSWASQTPATAAVDADGLVTTLAEGQAVITATSEGVTGQATLQIDPSRSTASR